MDLERDLLEAISPSIGGENNIEQPPTERMGISENPIEITGKHIPIRQRQILTDLSKKCFNTAQKSNGIWIQDVILCGTPQRARQLLQELQGYLKGYGRSICLLTSHDCHIHIQHDCPFAGGSCRCFWRKKVKKTQGIDFRRRLRRSGGQRRLRGLTLPDWQRILLYFTTEGRRSLPPYIDGKVIYKYIVK